LRRYRNGEYLRLGVRDLCSLTTLEDLTEELSALASALLETALEYAQKTLTRAFGTPYRTNTPDTPDTNEPTVAEFAVIALGKLGGNELNFSSDIDILYVYSGNRGETSGVDDGAKSPGTPGTPGTKISLHDYFTKLSTMITQLISNVTEDGLCFRVDLDLRPEGRSGPIANSLIAMELYYESWGMAWERAAMIKANAVAGSRGLGAAFMEMIRPFVYRRHLDFSAIDEIRAMKERIDTSRARRSPETIDVKLGIGGIREIEFFCQALELIHGGKFPELREANTLKTLRLLTRHGLITDEAARTLSAGYVFLRRLEHRLQIVEGRQTQAIPPAPAPLERLARMMGFADTGKKMAGALFLKEYREVTGAVHDVYAGLFYGSEASEELPEEILTINSAIDSNSTEEEAARAALKVLGFTDTAGAFKRFGHLRSGPEFTRLSSKAKELLIELAPILLLKASEAVDPDLALTRLDGLLSALGGRTTYYSLLKENLGVIDALVKIFSGSEFLSNTLMARPEDLDILLSRNLYIPLKKREAFEAEFSSILTVRGATGTLRKSGYEERLDSMRRLRNEEIFRIGINDITGVITASEVAAQITLLADAALKTSVEVAASELGRLYPAAAAESGGASFGIIGLGKLGAEELIYGSDLDIIFIYEEGEEGASGGGTSTHEFFVKLGQKIISTLNIKTREGFCFNMDTRLRPSGNAGPLVVSKKAFLEYHRSSTAVWERQAMIKARAVAGDVNFTAGVLAELEEILYSKPLTQVDISEMLKIRERMEVEIAVESAARYNVKTGRGGLVDIEFLTQALQLRYGKALPETRKASTTGALRALFKAGIIQETVFGDLTDAYSFLRLLEMRLRVVHDRAEGRIVPGSTALDAIAKRGGYPGIEEGKESEELLLKRYLELREVIRGLYLKTLEGLAEE
jgi:glutamate-ammonia-ligase adenylyltransferase